MELHSLEQMGRCPTSLSQSPSASLLTHNQLRGVAASVSFLLHLTLSDALIELLKQEDGNETKVNWLCLPLARALTTVDFHLSGPNGHKLPLLPTGI